MVSAIQKLDNKRYQVFLDEKLAFVLYRGELATYGVREGQPIEESSYRSICEEVLPKRAKKRCLNLLKNRPYTEYKLRQKLKEGFYAEEVIDEAISYVKSYHYIDDYDYACQYMESHKGSWSRRKMEENLLQKGISKEVIEQAIFTAYEDEEEEKEQERLQARRLLEKRHYQKNEDDRQTKQKLYGYLMRKGIRSEIIREVLSLTESYS